MSKNFRSNGHLLTVPLFYERAKMFQKDISLSLFSIEGRTKENPVNGLPLVNAKDTYVSLRDPTGYKWAKLYLESYDHFDRLMGAMWFKELKTEWDREIEMALRSEALDTISSLSKDSEAPEGTRLSAAKYLAEKGWEKRHKQVASKGRPTNASVTREAKKLAQEAEREDKDMHRLGLKVVKGGKDG
jgi:hypothetical protein